LLFFCFVPATFLFVPPMDSSEQRERGNVTLHPVCLRPQVGRIFPIDGEPNVVSVSLPGSNALALAAGGKSHSSDKRIKTEFSISLVQYSARISFISALLKFFPFFFFVS
jgi:hypothetical protein